jgi:hypothetical protein
VVCSNGVLSPAEISIEQAIARTGTIEGAVRLTGADPRLVLDVGRRMDRRCGLRDSRPRRRPASPQPPLSEPAAPDVVTALRTGASLKDLARELVQAKRRRDRLEQRGA